MNQALKDFLAARLPLPGLAAWSARMPDRTFAQQCYVNWFTPARAEEVLTRLTLAAEGFRHQNLDPVRLCWKFENLNLHLALRPDGACLGLLLENLPETPAVSVNGVLEEFLRLGSSE